MQGQVLKRDKFIHLIIHQIFCHVSGPAPAARKIIDGD